MGTIPTYESKGLVRAPNLPRQTGEALNRDRRATDELIGSMRQVEQMADRVKDQQEHNAANVYATEQLTALKIQAENDPDFKNSDKYAKEMARIGGDAAKNISGPNARDNFSSQFKMASIGAMESIKSTFRKRQLDAAHADLLTGIESQKDAYFNAVYPQDKLTAAAMIKQSIKDNVNSLVITAEDGVKLWKSIQDELPEKDAALDIGKNPEIALQRLKNNSYGIKDEEKRAKLIKDAEQAEIRLRKMDALGFARVQEQVAHDLTMQIWDDSLTLPQIKEQLDDGTLDKKDADVFRSVVLSSKTSDLQNPTPNQAALQQKTHDGTLIEMTDMLANPKINDFEKRRRILKSMADGSLRKEDAQNLYTGFLISPENGAGGKMSLQELIAAKRQSDAKNHLFAGAQKMFRQFLNLPAMAFALIDEEGDA